MAQIVLDAEAFKALSSDTRLQILKALDARRLTVSELGRLLDLNKATVFEHLKQLSAADLVKKDDEGRKWVYYRLTWKGKNVLHPENVQFMLLLATSVFSVGGLVAQIGNLMAWWGASPRSSELSPTGNEPASPVPVEGMSSAQDSAGGGASATQGTMAQGTAAPARSVLEGADAGPQVADASPEANLWLVATLVLLVLVTAVFAWRYLLERRRERLPLRKQIDALPPPEADAV